MIAAIQAADRRALLAWTQAAVFVSVVAAIVSPFSAPVTVCGAFVLQAFWIVRDHGGLGRALLAPAWSPAGLAVAAFIGYLAARLLPPPVPSDALIGLFSMALFALAIFGTFALLARQNDDVQVAIAGAFLCAFAVGATLQAADLLTGFGLRRALWTWLPMVRPRAEKLTIDGQAVRTAAVYIANPTSAILAAYLWPALLITRRFPLQNWQRWIGLGAATAAVVAIFLSDQATSRAAVVAGAVAWLAATALPRATRPLLTMAWLGSVLLVLPAAWYGYKAEGYRLPHNFSAQHRVVIWGLTAERTLQHPVFGIGLGKTPLFDDSMSADVKYVPGTQVPIATNRHAHNVFLQAWYEVGAVGAILLALAGLPIVGWIARAPAGSRALLAAAFCGAVISASFSYSLLSSWFLASFALTALFSRFAVDCGDRELPYQRG